jgi:hypothetical protein
MYEGSGRAISCSQSRIVSVGYLRLWRTEQVEAAFALSVVVRSGPVEPVVNGRLVARLVRTTGHGVVPLAPQ